MKNICLLLVFVAFSLANKAQTVTDADGNIYNTVTIGTQVWMKANLKTTKYNDGASIPNVTDDNAWNALATPAYCWYNNSATTYKATYGALYNWYTVNTGKLCPVNWHVPTSSDWDTLIAYLGGSSVAGGKIKETGTVHWNSPNTGATNSSGFTALSAGWRWSIFEIMGVATAWGVNDDAGGAIYCQSEVTYTGNIAPHKTNGYSVRCLKNTQTSVSNLQLRDNVTIYPNPAKDKLYIKIGKLSEAHLLILDLQGKQVFNKQVVTNPVDISMLPKGVYLVKIIDKDNIITTKLLKE